MKPLFPIKTKKTTIYVKTACLIGEGMIHVRYLLIKDFDVKIKQRKKISNRFWMNKKKL